MKLLRHIKHSCILFLALISTSIAFGQANIGLAPEVKIQSIEVIGNVRIEKDSILNKVWHKAGGAYRLDKVEEDVKSLFGMGLFDRIFIKKQTTGPEQIKLIYIVRELPVIKEILIEGNDNYDDDEFKKELGLKDFQLASPQKIEDGFQKVKKKYIEKGYYLADLSYELVPTDKPQFVKLLIKIDEHERISIRKVLISGNTAFNDSEIKQIMLSKEGHAFSFMTQAGRYHEFMFAIDVQKIQELYLNWGYARVKIRDPKIMYSPDKRWVTLQFHIDEGKKYTFGKVSIEPDGVFTEEELKERSIVREGRTFSGVVMKAETRRISDLYGNKGYAFTNVVPDIQIDDEKLEVSLAFKVQKGSEVTIRNINISGNTTSFDKVIRRELRIYEGKKYSSSLRRLSESQVKRLGFFDKVVFKDKIVPEHPGLLDIDIEVQDKKSTGSLRFSAGYSSQDGVVAQAQVSQSNFLGSGQLLQLNGVLAGSHTRIILNYYEPYFLDYHVGFGTSLYYKDRNVNSNLGLSFTELKGGGTVQFAFPVSMDAQFSLTYKFEDITLKHVFNKDIVKDKDNEGILSSAIASLIWDSRNNRMRPTAGLYGLADAEFAGIGGDLKFLKTTVNLRWYVPIFWGIVFRTNIRLGAVFSIGDNEIPVSERFVLGGINDLRGFKYGAVGPLVCAKPTRFEDGRFVFADKIKNRDRDIPNISLCDGFNAGGVDSDGLMFLPFNIGGRFMYLLNTEFEFPILPKMGIRGVFFVDLGAAFDSLDEKPIGKVVNDAAFEFPDGVSFPIRLSIGWGIRWWSPLGPLRLEFGHALLKGTGDLAFEPHFAFSSAF